MRTPWLVVRGWPLGSARNLSKGPPDRFTPGAAGSPVFSERFSSVSVLAVASRRGGGEVAPACGLSAFSRPCSPALVGLYGMALAIAATAAAFSMDWLGAFWPPGGCAGPLSVRL